MTAYLIGALASALMLGYPLHRYCVLNASDSLEPLVDQDEWDEHVDSAVALAMSTDAYDWLDDLSMAEVEMAGAVLADIDRLVGEA